MATSSNKLGKRVGGRQKGSLSGPHNPERCKLIAVLASSGEYSKEELGRIFSRTGATIGSYMKTHNIPYLDPAEARLARLKRYVGEGWTREQVQEEEEISEATLLEISKHDPKSYRPAKTPKRKSYPRVNRIYRHCLEEGLNAEEISIIMGHTNSDSARGHINRNPELRKIRDRNKSKRGPKTYD